MHSDLFACFSFYMWRNFQTLLCAVYHHSSPVIKSFCGKHHDYGFLCFDAGLLGRQAGAKVLEEKNAYPTTWHHKTENHNLDIQGSQNLKTHGTQSIFLESGPEFLNIIYRGAEKSLARPDWKNN